MESAFIDGLKQTGYNTLMNVKLKILIIFLIISIIAMTYAFFIEPNKIEVKTYNIENEDLRGIKIVYASDFHYMKSQQKRAIKVVDLINKQNPDLILLGGDFVNGNHPKNTLPIDVTIKELSKLNSPNGVYTVLGNHDWWQNGKLTIELLKKHHIKVLQNSNESLFINGKKLYIAGVDDYLTQEIDTKKALNNTKNPTILLSHSPAVLSLIQEKVSLIICGHSHGGQIALPLIGAIIVPPDCDRKLAYGLFNIKGNKAIISSGIGTSSIHARFNMPPEIVVIHFY